ncbi:MAG: carboxymuconolactone decarboxylase family protein [Candidatus Marinarcus sp.]|uniref:carboxymuconolactone decarboxylase family protein n=1 Tax=Candidatus Marinarcus sp. TaxID=3100987 RepID=UPI003AFF76ED
MPLIKTYEKEEATGELLEIYEEIIKLRGEIGNNAKLFSSSTELLKQQLEFIKYYATHETLSMPLLASIRVCVSNQEKCNFCIDFNSALLINKAKWSSEDVNMLKDKKYCEKLTKEENALLKFVINSVKNPHAVSENTISELKEQNWSDKDILDALNHGARMYATDILFNSFKIEDYQV